MEKSSPRWWDFPSAVFLFLAILFSAWRLQSTSWTDGLEHIRNVALLGLIVGLALGQSLFQKRGVVLLSIGYLLVIFIWQWLGFIKFAEEEAYLGDKLLILAGRLLLGLSEFASGRPVKDPLFFVALLSIPYCFASLISGYQLTRHAHGLAAILPSGILMFLIYLNHYTPRDYTWLFGAYLFTALLLLGRQKYLVDRKKWRENRVQISVESGMDFNNAIMVCTAILLLLVWLVPVTLPVHLQARKMWQRISANWSSGNERFEDLFASVKKDNLPSRDYYRNELPLGTRISQSESVTFLVYAPAAAQEYPRLYWRGRIYDRFEEGRWLTSEVYGKNHEPQDGEFEIPDTENRKNVSFTYNVYIKGQAILYTAAQPVWVSHRANIVHTKIPSEKEEAEIMDIVTVQASPYLEAGETYHSKALLANPTVFELRKAGDDYPAWVTDKYLQLPEDFSPRIQALALELAATHDNPYDTADAITNYLRSEIEYSPVISFPEDSMDRLEYFLFEGKQGFCNYYASAGVLMLRAVGVPARLAVGFAQGEANLQNTFYTVRERDAHAWPEVYFPGYGWIEFEPTGNQEPVQRPQEREEQPAFPPDQINTPLEFEALEQEKPQVPVQLESPNKTISNRLIFQLSILAGGFILVLLAILLKKRYIPNVQTAVILKSMVERNGWEAPAWLDRWYLWTALLPTEKYFHSINASLRWMGKPQSIHVTAAERAVILQKLIPAAAPSIQTLLREHQSALFSPHGGDVPLARRAARNILYQAIYARLKIFILGYN
ncbi:MAG: transglutaminase-like domain-containing protein [Anaerolineales bacterium]|nr:MAG: transglutaminase-like domain-containing protein [Anaerolineales bacterium]